MCASVGVCGLPSPTGKLRAFPVRWSLVLLAVLLIAGAVSFVVFRRPLAPSPPTVPVAESASEPDAGLSDDEVFARSMARLAEARQRAEDEDAARCVGHRCYIAGFEQKKTRRSGSSATRPDISDYRNGRSDDLLDGFAHGVHQPAGGVEAQNQRHCPFTLRFSQGTGNDLGGNGMNHPVYIRGDHNRRGGTRRRGQGQQGPSARDNT